MKKTICFIFLAIMLFGLFACNYDLYSGKRPYDYDDATWVCQEFEGSFSTFSEAEDYYDLKGSFVYEGKTYLFRLSFPVGSNQVLVTIKEPEIDHWLGYKLKGFNGDCEFSPDKLIIHISKKTDTFFEGKVDTLTFVREKDDEKSS